MSIDKNHSEEFNKYLNGEMSPAEANAFERKILNDPFAQEALEGLEDVDQKMASENIELLKNQIAGKSNKGISMMRIAAVVALLIVSSFTLWFSIDQVQPESAKELSLEENTIQAPANTMASDSILKEETEELIADATPINPKVNEIKKDGFKVADTNELIDKKIDQSDIEEIVPIETLTLAEANTSIEETDDAEIATIEQALQGRVAGVQITKSEPAIADLSEIDSSKLDADLLTQPLIAQENSNQESQKKFQPEETSKRITIRGQGSLARSADASGMTVTGKVTDDIGEALPGVNVIIKGTTTGTQTDLDGNYMLPKLNKMSLVFSFIGFESQEVVVGARTSIDVSMGGAMELQEVVVVGYGVSEKESTSSYSSAKPSIGNRKYTNYLKDNLQYPEQAKRNNTEGTIVLELTISSSGTISNIDIKKSLGYGCDEEAIRLVNEGSKWNPAQKDGVNVEDKVKVRVKFKNLR